MAESKFQEILDSKFQEILDWSKSEMINGIMVGKVDQTLFGIVNAAFQAGRDYGREEKTALLYKEKDND
tara:strand:- start:134 stop:340 length:207 start_codon:yes stop_codon:yes gene_type:complete